VERYAALWFAKSGDDEAQLYVGLTAEEAADAQARLNDAKLVARALQALRGLDGNLRYSGVWGRLFPAGVTAQSSQDLFEANFADTQARLSEQAILDVAVSEAARPQTVRERAQTALAQAEKRLKAKPDDVGAPLARALADLRLGESQKALNDLQAVLAKEPENASAQEYRIIALARLDKKQDATSELAKFEKAEVPEHSKLFLAAVVPAELGESTDKAIAAFDAALKNEPEDSDLRYDAVRAFALASKAVSANDRAKADELTGRALELLKQLVSADDAEFARMDDDPALDPIRDNPGFRELMESGHPDRRYAAVWTSAATHEAIPVYGLDPAGQEKRCRELMAEGYRPVSLSIARTSPDGPLVTASVWHRPIIREDAKDSLAERQARAAIALVRMGKIDKLVPLLVHSPDPRLRSFIINWLKPLGAEPGLILDFGFSILDSRGKPLSDRGGRDSESKIENRKSKMDSVLFDPETSIRRALILALGTYSPGAFSPSERERLVASLLDLFKNDPDSGIHAAAEWTLRQWSEQAKLKAAEPGLPNLKARGNRRWFVNKEGQTFALIEGPVEFTIGSPATEPERFSGIEFAPHRVMIPRRFAIAAKEVTVAQFQRFLKQTRITEERYLLPHDLLNKLSPDPDGSWIGPEWYGAAHYCNWLSEQEGLPKDEWCYEPAAGGGYAEGMIVPADVLKRKGFRLPTEAEWEYACRAAAVTSRYYGASVELLAKYARYEANSAEHAWPGGSLLPNDLGLFDMLGNVWEWCLDREDEPRVRVGRRAAPRDYIHTSSHVIEKHHRLHRGGAFLDPPAIVRSAFRVGYAPTNRHTHFGFRPARTCN
jgi:formylglycine-generating enzyme required for sulfatase activity/tetratricopeptide (TPR) repeat protein